MVSACLLIDHLKCESVCGYWGRPLCKVMLKCKILFRISRLENKYISEVCFVFSYNPNVHLGGVVYCPCSLLLDCRFLISSGANQVSLCMEAGRYMTEPLWWINWLSFPGLILCCGQWFWKSQTHHNFEQDLNDSKENHWMTIWL